MYVLDTNAVSALMRGDRLVIERLRQLDRSDVSVPQPVLAEIAYGIARLPRSRRRAELEARAETIRGEIPRADWTDAVSAAFGTIKAALERAGKRIEDFDAAIAAHALAVHATLVTANVTHLTRIPGLTVEDWTTSSP
ncbi:MAG TPA: PIN domain-containing protein [Gemmatimonadaceae bacterium]|nr:PIN domain-containing protein [Gemmatimonadaceae bacterium]